MNEHIARCLTAGDHWRGTVKLAVFTRFGVDPSRQILYFRDSMLCDNLNLTMP
jgi:hypothetical protein